jgi:hypothetical protein
MKYKVVETPMFPAKFQVVPVNGLADNLTSNFFRNRAQAQAEAERRSVLVPPPRMETKDK